MNLDEDETMTQEQEQLERRTRGLTSRRMDIPPTPRDTLAVLRQAAAAERERPAASWIFSGLARAVMGLAALLLLFAGFQWWAAPSGPEGTPLAQETAETVIDPGLDLVDWDLEFEAAWDEVDETLAALEAENPWETL